MGRMQNIVTLEDGILCYAQVGNQTRETSLNTIATLRFLTGGLSEVKLLVDYTNSGTMEEESIQSGFFALKVLPITKVAIIGATPYLKELVTTMAKAAGKSELIHFAKSREAAVNWLNK